MNKKTFTWILIILLHALAFSYQLIHETPYLTDSKGYLQEAENIRTHFIFYCNSLSEPTDLRAFSMRPPLYPLFLAIIKSVWNSDLFVLFCQNLLSFFNFWLIFKLLKPTQLIQNQYIYLLLAILFFPAQALYANLIMAEILLQTLLVLFFYAAIQFIRSKHFKHFALVALWLSLAILTKPVMQFFALIYLAGAIYFTFKEKQKKLLIAGILPLFVILAFSYRNYIQTGYFHFSSIKEINLLHYNMAFFLQKQHGLAYADSVEKAIETQAGLQPTFRKQQEYINQACTRILTKNLWPYLQFHLKGVVHFFLDPGRFDLYTFLNLQSQNAEGLLTIFSSKGYAGVINYLRTQPILILFYLVLIFIFNAIRLVFFIRSCFLNTFSIGVRLLCLLLVCYIAFLTGPLGASRFLVPVFPVMLYAAVSGFPNFGNKTDTIQCKIS